MRERQRTNHAIMVSGCFLPQVVKFLSNLWILKDSLDHVWQKGFTLLGPNICHSLFLLQKCCDCNRGARTDQEEVAAGLAFFGSSP